MSVPGGAKSMSHGVPSPLWIAATGLLGCILLGCAGGGDGPDRYVLSGSVTFDGKPVPFGEIHFEPDTSAGNSGPQGYAEILNGKYQTSADRGTVGGPHVVRITGFPADPSTEDEENPLDPLFPEYETSADLPKQKSTMDFDVPVSGS